MSTPFKQRIATVAVGSTLAFGTIFGGSTIALASPPPVAAATPVTAALAAPSNSAGTVLPTTTSIALASDVKLAVSPVSKKNNWASKTAQFAGCLGGFGFVAVPIVTGFMFGGPAGAVSAAKAWIPRLGPVGTGVAKWCMSSVLGVKM